MNKKSIGWGLFSRCNMNCRECYASSGESGDQYSFQELKEIADRICPHVTGINFGTGEFVCSINALELADYIKDGYPSIDLAVTTNGYSLCIMDRGDRKKIYKLFHDVDVSIDFPDPERHNSARRHPQAWKWAIRSLEICQDEGIETSIVTHVTSQTSDEDIEGFLELCRRYGRISWRASFHRQTGRDESGARANLTPKRVWEIMRFLSRRVVFEALDPLMASILGVAKPDSQGCACGKTSCRIQKDGTITPCVFLKGKEWSGGSVMKRELEDIFQSKPFQALRNRKPEYCQDCRYWTTCQGGCAARAYLHSGSLNAPDDYCPMKAGLDLPWIQGTKIETAETDKVHGGYLCTLICRPKIVECF